MMTGARSTRRFVAVACLLSACASSELDRYFEEGSYAQVVASFEADSTLATDEDALFMTGVAHALPGPEHDAARAEALLLRLLRLYPETEHRQQADWILSFLEREEALSRELAAVSDTLDRLKAMDPRRAAGGSSAGAIEVYQLVEAGRYAEATELFAADSTLSESELALFHAAVAYAVPGTDVHDPWRARELFERFLALHPDSRYAGQATRYTEFLGLEIGLRLHIQRLTDELEELKAIDLGPADESAEP